VTLAPVHVATGADLGGGDLEVILTGGDRVRIRASASADILRRVIDVFANRMLNTLARRADLFGDRPHRSAAVD
jgi:hypothetical protein